MDFKIAVGYARTSGEINPKTSIPNQINAIKEYCQNHQIILRKIYMDECKTGTRVEGRDGYLEMKHALEKENINTVVVSNYDRFGRDSLEFTKTIVSLKKIGVGVISVSQGSNSIDMSTIQIAMSGIQAEMENKFRIERLKTGREHVRKLGKFNIQLVPYGYQLNENRHLVINPHEAPIVQELFETFIREENFTRTYELIKAKYPSFPITTIISIKNTLLKGLYIGKDCIFERKSDGTVDFELISPQQHEPIISEEMFLQVFHVIEKIESKYKTSTKRPYANYILANVIECEICRKPFRGNK
ncbi:recombinase family protein [Cytobacillus sp. Hz8]|uniref:recombinase family protein n=1 Tax=Cytobacillus sp. Hz8 TaxID=3347168 RepID=UPI0035E1E700